MDSLFRSIDISKISSEPLNSILNGIGIWVNDIIADEIYEGNFDIIDQMELEASLLILSLIWDNSDDGVKKSLFEEILDELPNAINEECKSKISRLHSSVRVFIGNRLLYYKEQVKEMFHQRDNEVEGWYKVIINVIYLIREEPICPVDETNIQSKDYLYFEMDDNNSFLPFIDNIITIVKKIISELPYIEYEKTVIRYMDNFKTSYGEKKYLEILEKVLSSDRSKRFINNIDHVSIIPTEKDIIGCVMSIPYFYLAKKETIGMGGVFLINMWYFLVIKNKKYVSEEVLTKVLNNVLKKSHQML
jgi:hypothetical protein